VWAVSLIWLLSNFVWFFGIHGIVVVSVVNPILISIDLDNLEKTSAGLEATQIIGKNFTNVYGGMTGAGIIMGLIILMTFFAKSKQYRTLGRLSIVPDIFSIAEPAIFGTPIVLNLVLIIPFMIIPTISTIVAFFLTKAGILPILSGIQLPWSMPVILQGFLLGGWRVALYQAALLVFSALAYYPFFKVLDQRAFAIENGEIEAD
jgi:PTS system cellobiose-specific IIC component